MSDLPLFPCSHCSTKDPRIERRSGRAGRISRTPFYRETITCKSCKISVTAGTPGNAVALWNRASAKIGAPA